MNSSMKKDRKTIHISEFIACFVLLQNIWSISMLVAIISFVILVISYFIISLRHLSRSIIIITGLLQIFITPLDYQGYVLVLCGTYMILNSPIIKYRYFVLSFSIFSILFIIQLLGIIQRSDSHFSTISKILQYDILIIVLAYMFLSKCIWINPKKGTFSPNNISVNWSLDRDLELLKLVWSGKSTKEISYVLNISHGTVRTNLSRLYKKFNVPCLTKLYSIQFTHHIIWKVK